MKKRIGIFVASMLIALSLTACGNNSSTQTSPQQTPAAQNNTPVQQDSIQSNPGTGNQAATPDAASLIGDAQALETALTHAGLTADVLTFSQVTQEFDDGFWTYNVEFFDGTKEYDYEIDATNGTILSVDQDMEAIYAPADGQTTTPILQQTPSAPDAAISQETATQTALERVPGATTEHIRIMLEMDDGRTYYEGTIIYDNMEYSFEIDANTGNIMEWEAESVFD